MLMTSRRDILKKGSAAIVGTSLAGCLGNPSGSDSEKLNLAIVSSPSGFGDKAFNDLALQGLQKAKKKFGANIQKVQETNQSQYQSVQSRLAESSDPNYDVIVLVSYNHTKALETNAKEYSDQNWMLINDTIDRPNVAGYIWANNEMAYQAGVLAGTMTTKSFSYKNSSTNPDKKAVGFVGGEDSPLIRAFEKSYIAGVHRMDKNINVNVGYAGTYTSPQKGKQIALSQYDNGADIVFHAAAATGQGIFQAAQQKNRFGIGTDADQSKTLSEYKDVIMGSSVKYINKGTFEVAKAVNNDKWDSVQGKNVLGLDDNGVKLVLGQSVGSELPQEVQKNLDSSRKAIVDGDVKVPCTASGCNS